MSGADRRAVAAVCLPDLLCALAAHIERQIWVQPAQAGAESVADYQARVQSKISECLAVWSLKTLCVTVRIADDGVETVSKSPLLSLHFIVECGGYKIERLANVSAPLAYHVEAAQSCLLRFCEGAKRAQIDLFPHRLCPIALSGPDLNAEVLALWRALFAVGSVWNSTPIAARRPLALILEELALRLRFALVRPDVSKGAVH
jgi:hypothetical protein